MSDSESEYGSEYGSDVDSDTELQKAFSEGRLKAGLNDLRQKQTQKPRPPTNDVAGLEQKLEEFQQNLPWEERLDVTLDPVQPLQDDEVDDDFKMEMAFYRQAQAAVLHALPRLQKLGIPTKRPDDYFAEMAKPDHHMKKIREKLMERKVSMERSEQAKKLREARKYGKKVQQEVALKRQQEKKALGDAVKKFRKGKANNLEEILEGGNKKSIQTNKKRQQRDRKFGFGGQKKRGKRNTKESLDAPWKSSGKARPGQGKGKQKATRLGKARRMQNKNKKK